MTYAPAPRSAPRRPPPARRPPSLARAWPPRPALWAGSAIALLTGCSALWDSFLTQRPCSDASACPAGQTCNLAAGQCQPVDSDGGTTPGSSTVGPPISDGICPVTTLCWENPLPQGNDLQAVSSLSSRHVWAVGRARTVLFWDGKGWAQGMPPITINKNDLYGVHASTLTDTYIVGNGGFILHGNAAAGWMPEVPNFAHDLRAVSVSDGFGIATSAAGQLFYRSNGPNWNNRDPMTGTQFLAAFAVDKGNFWAAGGQGRIVNYVPGNGPVVTLSVSGTNVSLYAIWGRSGTDLWAAGFDGTTQHGNGSTWTAVTTLPQVNITGLWGNTTDLWAASTRPATRTGQLYRLTSNAWQTTGPEIPTGLNAITGSPENTTEPDIWAVGNNGAMVHGNGSTWIQTGRGFTSDLQAVWGTTETDIWAAGASGTLLHSDGINWRKFDSPTVGTITGLHGTGPNDVWAVDIAGNVLHYNGTAWSLDAQMPDTNLRAVITDPTGSIYMVGTRSSGGVFLRRNTSGTIETLRASNGTLRALWRDGNGKLWLGGDSGNVFVWIDNAFGTVNALPMDENVHGFGSHETGNVYAVTTEGNAHLWDGSKWTLTLTNGTPTFLGVASQGGARLVAVGIDPITTGGLIGTYTSSIWRYEPLYVQRPLRAIWVSPGNQAWLVGDGGAILRYKQ